MNSLMEMQSMASKAFSAYASLAASMMLFRSVARDIIPPPVKSFLCTLFSHFFKHFIDRFFLRSQFSANVTMVVDEHHGLTRNQIYDAAEVYLRTKINPNAERLKVNKNAKQGKITLSMVKDQEVWDCYHGFDLKWKFVLVEGDRDKGRMQAVPTERRYFELTFEKSKKQIVVDEYLPFVIAKSNEIKDEDREVKLYTRDCTYTNRDEGGKGGGYWGHINLDHPQTFDKLAMDPILKRAIIDDLDRFLRRKDYYKKVGKAWKRGYLLYGPPGTGKSSLVAAMANYLKFDVYDLELTSLYSNSELRRILLCTNNRSILVIEDIDCNIQLHDRKRGREPLGNHSSKLTLSGFLNFIDGLWSTCGDERIIIFTTNHKDKLDPALLRPGRMDMHIHMGYCTPEGFDILASNYLGIDDHERLFPVIKELIREVEVSPAEIAEHLMRSDDVDVALEGVIDLLKEKMDKKDEEIIKGKGKRSDEDESVDSMEKENGEFLENCEKDEVMGTDLLQYMRQGLLPMPPIMRCPMP